MSAVISPYELSAEQVAEMKEWLRPWNPCPWCDAERPWSPGMVPSDQPITHRADCLLALVTEEPRAPSSEHEATAAILSDHHDTRTGG